MSVQSKVSVGIVDYGAGNIRSIVNSFEYHGCKVTLISDPIKASEISHLVLPGVGAFGFCRNKLFENPYLVSWVKEWMTVQKKPLMGICVGMQLLAEKSFELGEYEGLSIYQGQITKFELDSNSSCKVPHVGWNTVEFQYDFGKFKKGDRLDFYFDHSYACFNYDKSFALGLCNHLSDFMAIYLKENIIATQFHPEKSQTNGLQLIKSFLEM